MNQDRLNLTGLRAAPSQQCGSFRLVPLLRDKPCNDVKLGIEKYDQDFSVVDLGKGITYWSFIPHGFILNWGNEEKLSIGTQVKKKDIKSHKFHDWFTINSVHRMVKKRGGRTVRMLPLHLSMEYFLAHCFGGPNILWPEYSKFAKRFGLGVRVEFTSSGRQLYEFYDALRLFEIHEGQVGVIIYGAEELASVFVVPTPEDYRKVHWTLLEDFYGDLIFYYALMHPAQALTPDFKFTADKSPAALRKSLYQAREEWASFSTELMAQDLLDRDINTEVTYKPGDMILERFMTDIDLKRSNTIGERLVRENGEVLYMKTYLLSNDQSRKAWLLSNLAKHNWHVSETAKALKCDRYELIRRIERAGFGYIFNPDLVRAAMKELND